MTHPDLNNRRAKFVTAALAVATVAFLAASIFGFVRFSNYSRDLCENVNKNREPLRLIILDSQAQSQTRTFPATVTHANGSKEKVILTFPSLGNQDKFYERSLERLQNLNC